MLLKMGIIQLDEYKKKVGGSMILSRFVRNIKKLGVRNQDKITVSPLVDQKRYSYKMRIKYIFLKM
jgi:hypothetical protein